MTLCNRAGGSGWAVRAPGSGGRDVLRWLLLALVGVALASLMLIGPAGAEHGGLAANPLYGAALLSATAYAAARAGRCTRNRSTWGLLAAAQAVGVGGALAWGTAPGHASRMVTSGDVARFVGYIVAGTALVRLARAERPRIQPNVLLDALTGGLAVAAAGATWVSPHLRVIPAGPTRLPQLVALAHPLADLLLVCLVVSLVALLGWRPDRSWVLLGAAFTAAGLADSAYIVRAAAAPGPGLALIEAGWLLAATMLALACGWPSDPRPRSRPAGWASIALPAAFTATGIVVLVAASVNQVSPLGVALAAATLVASGSRLTLTFHQLHVLTDVQRQARTDELTGLVNRQALLDELGEALRRRGPDGTVALLIMDLDRFRDVNDSLGHPAGDRVLAGVATRLRGCVRPGDVLSRTGGDEFAILLTTAIGPEAAEDLAARLRWAITHPFSTGDATIFVDASVGIALAPRHADDAADLLQVAEAAMYTAKRQRTGHCMFDPRHLHESVEHVRVGNELRRAVNHGELEVHFQPKVAIGDGNPIGMEALLRWRHPQRGLLTPAAFLPHLVDPERIREVTAIVLDQALGACARWASTGVRLPLAVNVSAADLEDRSLPHLVVETLRKHGLPPQLLTLEVTETMLMTDPGRAALVLGTLRNLGVRVALDDYGTGFSSLTHLRDFPLGELKLDRTFVATLTTDRTTWAIVRSTVELAHTLGLTVVAEGVERQADLSALQTLGCDHGQGYLWSPALPGHQVLAWVTQRRAELASAALRVGAPVPTIASPERVGA